MGILSLIGAGASVASQAMANQQNEALNVWNWQNEREMLYRQNQMSQENATTAFERQKELFNLFQTPAAQRKMLEEAGLSVGMMYGNSGVGGNSVPNAQMASTPAGQNKGTIPYNPILNAEYANLIANARKLDAETRNIESGTELNEAQRDSTLQDIPLKQRQFIILGHQIDKIDQEIENLKEQAKSIAEERSNTIQERENIKNEAELKAKQAELTQAQKDYQEAIKQLTKIDINYRGKIHEAEIKQLKAQAANLVASAKKIGIESDVLEKTKQYIIDKAFYETGKTALEYKFVTPQEIKILEENLKNAKNVNEKNEMWLNFFREHPKMYNHMLMNEAIMSGWGQVTNVPKAN